MIRKYIRFGLTLSLMVLLSPAGLRADEWDRKMVLTFSQPIEIPGHVLPAGTYMFKLAESASDRHIVQVFNADGSQIIATVIAIPRYRATPGDQSIVTFREASSGSPESIRAWFYPGIALGQEFVYPKPRAALLAKAAAAPVPAIAVMTEDPDVLRTVPIVAIAPDEKETPIALAAAPDRVEEGAMSGVGATRQSARNATQLPRTAGALPLIALAGIGSIGIAFGLMMRDKRALRHVAR